MYKILVSDPISDQGLQLLYDTPDVEVTKLTNLSETQLLEIIGEYDALLVRSQTKVTSKIIEAGTRLKAIGRAGVGVDNIDLQAATEHGVIVINAPDGNTIATCEHTFAMMMSVARQIPQAYHKTISGVWDRKSFVGVELRNKVLGIIGMGRIGTEVAFRAKAFGMEVLGYDPFLTEERAAKIGITLTTVNDIASKADFITVHTPLTNETRHIISTEQFQLMKPGIRIINCARGGIVDEQALIQALNDDIVAGAAFDVLEQEPPENDHTFLNHPKVIITPHLGASTIEAQENVAIDVAEQILYILKEQPFKNAVNMPPVPSDLLNKLQPYFSLGDKLGLLAGQLAQHSIHSIEINYAGDLADVDTAPLTRYIVKGVFSTHIEGVNIVNALHHAKLREINVTVQKTTANRSFTNLVTVNVKTKQGDTTLAGTLLTHYGERIVLINDYPVDLTPDGNILFISHNDKPGIIGKVGTILGKNDVNIASMQVGRKDIGGSAIMLLRIDNLANKDVVAQLEEQPEIVHVKQLRL